MLIDQVQGYSAISEIVKIQLDDKEYMVMGRRVIDGPDRSRLLIDVPTGILIDCRSEDITPAIGSVNSSSLTGTHHPTNPHPFYVYLFHWHLRQ